MDRDLKGKKIYVGLSGGVDSAVTAALLQQAGANITGVFIKGWYPPELPCTWAEDRQDAMRVAAKLQIPFETFDASKEYKQSVLDYLLSEYAAGRTPNPDIMCNRDVKFGAFYTYARAQGADYVATGHYAHTKEGKLYRGVDPEKDQSYFLWAVPHTVLEHVLFPLGGMHKTEVRALAQKFDLPVAKKKDSQGICFLGSISVEEFLKQECGIHIGNAIDEEGNPIGTHEGVVLYTLGERVPLTSVKPGPWYVLRKDFKENILVVSHEKKLLKETDGIRLSEQNWITAPEDTMYNIQYRYHGPRIEGTLNTERNTFIPNTSLTEQPAEGQSLVFYRGEECIGGAIIDA